MVLVRQQMLKPKIKIGIGLVIAVGFHMDGLYVRRNKRDLLFLYSDVLGLSWPAGAGYNWKPEPADQEPPRRGGLSP
jgi:hypothetical protein